MLALLAGLLSGCGGVQASRSVSPASILVPGLLQADPATNQSDAEALPQAACSPEVATR